MRTEGEAKRQKKHLIARATFSGLFILMLLVVTITNNEQRQVLAITECIKDYTFVWTEGINTFFVDNTGWKDFAIIQSSIGIDFMMLSFLVIFAIHGTTLRIVMTLGLFYPSRNVIQAIFLMGRPVGFLWSWPGIMSLTVPYFDTNDFYFSGHVGSTTMYASEYIAMGWKKMAITITCIVVDVWVTLMFLRTHYIIDFTSGYVFARFVHRIGEKLSYYPDVKLFGYPKQKRFAHNYSPCARCGWGNPNAELLMDEKEIEIQKELYVATMIEQTKGSGGGSTSPLMQDEFEDRQRMNPKHNAFAHPSPDSSQKKQAEDISQPFSNDQ